MLHTQEEVTLSEYCTVTKSVSSLTVPECEDKRAWWWGAEVFMKLKLRHEPNAFRDAHDT